MAAILLEKKGTLWGWRADVAGAGVPVPPWTKKQSIMLGEWGSIAALAGPVSQRCEQRWRQILYAGCGSRGLSLPVHAATEPEVCFLF